MEWMTALMRGVSRQTYSATFPPDRFYCLLEELPFHLVPRRARKLLPQDDLDEPLYLNPECILSPAERIPDELTPELLSGFALHGQIAWVRNSATRSLLPFWLGTELADLLRRLPRSAPVRSSLSVHLVSLLTAAEILVPEGRLAQRQTEREETVKKAAALFREKGFAPLGGLIHPFHIAALRRYYRYLIRAGVIQLGDRQSPRRYAAYNEPVAQFFHHQIAAMLSAVAGEPLKPSYVYLASYLSGAELKKHTDREQCEFSITLCLDFSPEPALATPWPIQLEIPSGTVAVYQALGDGLAYRGTRLPHYRGVLGDGQTSTSIFFHYVAADFEGPLE